MEAVTGLEHERVSFRDRWTESCPEVANGVSLDDYMRAVCLLLSPYISVILTPEQPADDIWYDDYHNHDKFRADYWQKFQKAPYVSPAVRGGW